VKVSELEARLIREGWTLNRTKKHKVYIHANKPGMIVVPNHPHDELARGTLESIKKIAGWK
jgi:predicted RNA binding protein YcfA (HicA-like mRNA interferase family)